MRHAETNATFVKEQFLPFGLPAASDGFVDVFAYSLADGVVRRIPSIATEISEAHFLVIAGLVQTRRKVAHPGLVGGRHLRPRRAGGEQHEPEHKSSRHPHATAP